MVFTMVFTKLLFPQILILYENSKYFAEKHQVVWQINLQPIKALFPVMHYGA